jgi:hypothetical protein
MRGCYFAARSAARGAPAARSGRTIENDAPPPGRSPTWISPPCWSTIFFTIDREPEPGARPLRREVRVEDPLAHRPIDPGPLVRHGEDRAVARAGHAEVEAGPLRERRLDRVGGEVREDAAHEGAVERDGALARRPHHLHVRPLRDLRARPEELLHEGAEVRRLGPHLGQLRERGELVHEPLERPDLVLDDLARVLHELAELGVELLELRPLPARLELLERELHGRERVLDLVGEAARDLLPPRDLLEVDDPVPALADLAHHRVERAGEPRHLVGGPARVHLDGEIARGEALDGEDEVRHPARRPPRDEDAEQRRHHRGEHEQRPERAEQGPPDLLAELLPLARALPDRARLVDLGEEPRFDGEGGLEPPAVGERHPRRGVTPLALGVGLGRLRLGDHPPVRRQPLEALEPGRPLQGRGEVRRAPRAVGREPLRDGARLLGVEGLPRAEDLEVEARDGLEAVHDAGVEPERERVLRQAPRLVDREPERRGRRDDQGDRDREL